MFSTIELYKWIYFIKNVGKLDDIPMSFKESHILKAFEIADTTSLNEKEREIQFKQEDFIYIFRSAREKAIKDSLKAGREEGKEESKIETAKKSLAQGLDVKLISKITGLDEKVIIKLKSNK